MKNKLYEGMYIISATLSDESRKKALNKILDGITNRKGEVKKMHDLGRKKLAYSIAKKKEGHYYVVYFTAQPDQIKEMWKEYLLNEDLLRFMTVNATEVKESLEFKQIEV